MIQPFTVHRLQFTVRLPLTVYSDPLKTENGSRKTHRKQKTENGEWLRRSSG